MTNITLKLSGLLNSTGDASSPLSGRELVAAKVKELVVMGGEYPSGREYNFWGSNASLTAHVVNTWDGSPVTFIGEELGRNVLSGQRLITEGPDGDPVRAAYRWYTYGEARQSWDPLAVLYAVSDETERDEMFSLKGEEGYNAVDGRDGSNKWVWQGERAGAVHHWTTLRGTEAAMGERLDEMYLKASREAKKRRDETRRVRDEL